jgi:hypothetical protein
MRSSTKERPMKDGRKLEIGFKKDGDTLPSDPAEAEAHFERKVKIITRVVEKVVVKVGMAVCAYVVLDTARQVVVKGMDPT